MEPQRLSTKKFSTLAWLTGLLGLFGIDRFYLGKTGTGLVKLFTGGGFFVLYIVDIISAVRGKSLDKDGLSPIGYSPMTQRATYLSTLIFTVYCVMAVSLTSLYPEEFKQNSVSPQSSSAASCALLRESTGKVAFVIGGGVSSPEEATKALTEEMDYWYREARKHPENHPTGVWLRKMSSLNLDVNSFLLTGFPEDGPDKAEELMAQLALVDQYCE